MDDCITVSTPKNAKRATNHTERKRRPVYNMYTTLPQANMQERGRKTHPVDEKSVPVKFGRKHYHQIRRSNLAKQNSNKQQNTQQISRDSDLALLQPKSKQKRARSIKKSCASDTNRDLHFGAETQ